MAQSILALGATVSMADTYATATSPTGITVGGGGVVTVTKATHGLTTGDVIVWGDVQGMTQLSNRATRVTVVDTSNFTLDGIDGTGWGTFSSGSYQKVSAWVSFSNIKSISYPEPQPNRIDITTIHDSSKKEIFGLDDAPVITMNMNADPLDSAVSKLRAAALKKEKRAFLVTLVNGYKLLVNAYVAGGRGFDAAAGEVAQAQMSISLAAPETWMAS